MNLVITTLKLKSINLGMQTPYNINTSNITNTLKYQLLKVSTKLTYIHVYNINSISYLLRLGKFRAVMSTG